MPNQTDLEVTEVAVVTTVIDETMAEEMEATVSGTGEGLKLNKANCP